MIAIGSLCCGKIKDAIFVYRLSCHWWFSLCSDQDGLLGTKTHTWWFLERARPPAGGSGSFVRFGRNTGIDIVKPETKTTGLNHECSAAE